MIIDQNTAASITDGNTPIFDGGSLTVTIFTGEDAAEDLLSIDTSGSVSLSSTSAGGTVSVSGIGIGTLQNNIAAGNDLVVNFGSNATIARVTTLLGAVTYENTDALAPTTGARAIRVGVDDGDDGASSSANVTVTVSDINDEPTLLATGNDPSFIEGGSEADLFSSVTVGTVESGQTISGLTIVITGVVDGSSEIMRIDGSTYGLVGPGSSTTATNNLTINIGVSGSTVTITLSNGTMSTAATQTLIDNLTYVISSSEDDPTAGDRAITITELVDSGSSSGDNDNTATLSLTSTASVTPVNDEPNFSTSTSTPSFTEGDGPTSLFSSTSADTEESGQTFIGFSLTVTNVSDGSSERLGIDNSSIALTHANSGTTAGNGFSYAVSVSGSTATVTLSGGSVTPATLASIINDITYDNLSNDPDTTARVVTLVSVTDSGGTANSGDNTLALTSASTVSISALNTEPTFSATGSNPNFIENNSAIALFSSSSANTIESGQTIAQFIFTVTGVTDNAIEYITVDGSTLLLVDGGNGTTADNSLSYSVSKPGTTATVTISSGTLSELEVEGIINNLAYRHAGNDPTAGNRVVTITSITDSGAGSGSNDNTAALSVSSTVSVTSVNDEPSFGVTGGAAAFTEGGAASTLFSSSNANTVESGQTVIGVVIDLTNLADGANEILTIDGTDIAFSDGNMGTTANNSLSYVVGVSGSTATITITGGTLSESAFEGIIDAMTYKNTSSNPNTTNTRFVIIQTVTDSGGTSNSGDDTGSVGTSAMISITATNNAPSVTVPSSLAGAEDEEVTLTGISISDVDAGSSSVTVTITTSAGIVEAASGGSVTASGSETATVTLSGTVSNINSYLADNNVTVTNAENSTSAITVTITIDDGGNTGSGGALDDDDMITVSSSAVNDAPTFTVPSGFSADEDVATAITNITIADADAGGATITATLSATLGTLSASSGGSVTASQDGNKSVVLVGTISNINSFISGGAITYTGPTDTNGVSADAIRITADDAGNSGSGGTQVGETTVPVNISAVNDAPVITVPTPISGSIQDGATIDTVSISDDAISSLTVTFSVPQGTLSATSGSGVTVGGSSTALTLTGTISDINSFLTADQLTFSFSEAGDTTLTVQVDDGGDNGSGGAKSDTDTVTITLTNINDAPILTVPNTFTITEDTQTGLVGIQVSDIDADSETINVTVSVTAGTLSATSAGGVTATIQSETSVLLAGTVTSLSSYLIAGSVSFLPATDSTSDVTVTIIANDLGNSGTGGSMSDTATSTISIAPVNDAPTVSIPESITGSVVEGVVLSNITLSDVDAESNTINLVLSVNEGTLSAATGSEISVTGNDSSDITLSGTLSDLNNALSAEQIRFTPQKGGEYSLTITLDDAGNTGSGSSLSDSETVSLIVSNYEPIASPAYLFWNGFIDITNVASLFNRSESTEIVRVTVLDNQGQALGSTTSFQLNPNQQFDVIVNGLDGFSSNSFGLVKVEFGMTNAIDGNIIQYRFNATSGDYEFATKNDLSVLVSGTTYGIFNTFQPSLAAGEGDYPIQSWLQIANWEQSEQTFTVEKIDAVGNVIADSLTRITVPAQGRRDLEAGHLVPGLQQIGLIRITPDNASSNYSAQVVRYGSDTLGTEFFFASVSAVSKGLAVEHLASVSGAANTNNWLELANVSSSSNTVTLRLISNSGQTVLEQSVELPPLGQTHINMNVPLGGVSGVVIITPEQGKPVVLNSSFYYYNSLGQITDSNTTAGFLPVVESAFSNYNRFIKQSNYARLFNQSSDSLNVFISLYEQTGNLLGTRSIGLGAQQGFDIEVTQSLGISVVENSVGVVKFESSEDNALSVQMLRTKQGTLDPTELDIGLGIGTK